MAEYQYQLNCGQYVLHRDGKPVGALLDEVAIAFDKENGTLHKHGAPEMVNAWAQHAQQKLRAGGASEFADDLIVVTGRFTLDDLNGCLTHSGYIGVLYTKMLRGEVPALGLTGEAR
jgi:hypothetical protein